MGENNNNQMPPNNTGEDNAPTYLTIEDLNNFKSEFTQNISQMVTSAIGRAKKESAKETESTLKTILTDLIPTQQTGDQTPPANNPSTNAPPTTSPTTPTETGGDLKSQVAKLMEWKGQQDQTIQAQAQQIENQNQLIVNLQNGITKSKQEAEAERIKSDWIKTAGDSVHAPDQLLSLALTNGNLTINDQGKPVVQTNTLTTAGTYQQLEGAEAIANLLAQPQYSHFKKGASGGGTGAKPGQTATGGGQAPEVIEGIPLNETDEQRLKRIADEYGGYYG